MSRHARQIRLAEVGTRGQARIGAASVVVGLSGDAARVAVRYLTGAGVGRLQVSSPALALEARRIDPDVRVDVLGSVTCGRDDGEPDAFAELDPAARDVARGAASALAELRRALGIGEAGP